MHRTRLILSALFFLVLPVAERTLGANWVVTQGLAPGDKVIVQGTANLRPDAEIRPVPVTTPQRIEAPKGGQSGGAAKKGG